MKMHVKSGKTEKAVKIIKKEGDLFTVSIDNKIYELDVVRVEHGVYSILSNGESINMEMIAVDNSGSYKVNTLYKSFDIEVVPTISFSKEGKSRSNSHQLIKAPMPGRIVKIKVKEGDRVTEGTPLVVLSAMKMENELRSEGDGIVHKISIKEDEVVKDNQLLIDIKEIDKT